MDKKSFLNFCNVLKERGCSGSFSVKTGERNDEPQFLFNGSSTEREIHASVYNLDTEYECVAVLTKGYPFDARELPVLSKNENWEDAILFQGIAHTKAFILKETNAIVCFDYSLKDFLVAE